MTFCASGWNPQAQAKPSVEMIFVMKTFCYAAALVALFSMGLVVPAQAQVPPNCTVEPATDPDREVLRCAFGLVIEIEAAAALEITGEVSPDAPTAMDLNSGAAFIEVEPGAARPQIRTPHAIAAVRGTVYVVDVTETTTSVFVVEGEVTVSKVDDQSEAIVLGPGEGVDVASDTTLEANVWPAERARSLLARFGR